jgi:hypothetical protein
MPAHGFQASLLTDSASITLPTPEIASDRAGRIIKCYL